jgi:hypothetical protein
VFRPHVERCSTLLEVNVGFSDFGAGRGDQFLAEKASGLPEISGNRFRNVR